MHLVHPNQCHVATIIMLCIPLLRSFNGVTNVLCAYVIFFINKYGFSIIVPNYLGHYVGPINMHVYTLKCHTIHPIDIQTPRPRDLQYLESRCPQAVTPEQSKGVTKRTEGF